MDVIAAFCQCSVVPVCTQVHVWNAGTGQLQQKMTSSDPVIDLCPASVNDQSYLVALTEKQISVYRWNARQS